MNLAEKVVKARTARGLKKSHLAKEAGISPSAMTQIESGETSELKLSTAQGLSKALRVSPEYFSTPYDDWDKWKIESSITFSGEGEDESAKLDLRVTLPRRAEKTLPSDMEYVVENIPSELIAEIKSREIPDHIYKSVLTLLQACPVKTSELAPAKNQKKLTKAEYEHMAFMEILRMRDHGTPEERRVLSNMKFAIDNPDGTIGLSDEVFVIGDTPASDNTDSRDKAANGN